MKRFLEDEVLNKAEKLKGRLAPISEKVEGVMIALPIKTIYQLQGDMKNFFLIIVKNPSKDPKERYFLAGSLASQSSDLLVNLAQDFALKNEFRLIQYSIFPKLFRINLMILKETKTSADFKESLALLKDYRVEFRKKITNLKKLVENN